jgi:S-adenosylmethionine synthetase
MQSYHRVHVHLRKQERKQITGMLNKGRESARVLRRVSILRQLAQYVAKNVVAAGWAEECLVQLGYCIGLVDPVSVMVNTYGTGKLSEDALSALVRKVFPLSPKGIIDHLKLRNPVYLKTAAYGHFGRPDFAWEHLDAVDELLAKLRMDDMKKKKSAYSVRRTQRFSRPSNSRNQWSSFEAAVLRQY